MLFIGLVWHRHGGSFYFAVLWWRGCDLAVHKKAVTMCLM